MAFSGKGSNDEDERNAVSDGDDERGCGERAFAVFQRGFQRRWTKRNLRKLRWLRGGVPAERETNAL